MVEATEKVRLPVPVDVDVHVSEEMFEKALIRSKTYWESIKPRLDMAKFLEAYVDDPKEFYLWFYTTKDKTPEMILEKLTTGVRQC